MVFAKTPFKLKQAMPEILENADANLTPRMRNLVSLLWSEWKDLEHQIVGMNLEVEQIASSDPACQRLRTYPGIGPLVATAIVAAIGNGAAFRAGTFPPGWDLCHDNTRRGVRPGFSASASEATVMIASYFETP